MGCRVVEDVLPADILAKHPPELPDMGVGEYLRHIQYEDAFFEGIKHANLSELWDVMIGCQFNMSDAGVQQLKAIADHANCDFGLAIEVMLYADPAWFSRRTPTELDTSYELPAFELVRGIAARLNSGAYNISPDDTRTILRRLEHFQSILPETGNWRLAPAIYESAKTHATRLDAAR